MKLPPDLVSFLDSGRQLDVAGGDCETGHIVLAPLAALRVELFPTDVDNGRLDNTTDPHHGELGCYLVPAVSLVAECENYDPVGLLLWLPDEGVYGTWDSSHNLIEVFAASVTWSEIAGDPVGYLDSFWADQRAGGLAPLVPWPKYQYDPSQPTSPRPIR